MSLPRVRLTPWLVLSIIVACIAIYHITQRRALAWLEILGSVFVAVSELRRQLHR